MSLRSIYLVCSNNTDHQDHHEYCCCDLPSFDFCSNPTWLIETGPQRIERDSNANNLPEPHDLESQQHHKYKTWTGKSVLTIYLYIFTIILLHLVDAGALAGDELFDQPRP